MTCWFEGPLAAFDTETTGVDVEGDRIVSAALVVQDGPGARPRVTRWLINPGIPVPEGATAVHGLTDEHLRLNGRWPAPVMDEVAKALAEQCSAGRPLVIMNAPFDLTLLDRELRRHRAASLGHYLGRNPLRVLDPRVLDKHLDRYRKGRRTSPTCVSTTAWRWRGRTTRRPTRWPPWRSYGRWGAGSRAAWSG